MMIRETRALLCAAALHPHSDVSERARVFMLPFCLRTRIQTSGVVLLWHQEVRVTSRKSIHPFG